MALSDMIDNAQMDIKSEGNKVLGFNPDKEGTFNRISKMKN